MKDSSLGGAINFITFINDFSTKLWYFALKSKDQFLDVFKDFRWKVERGTSKQLKCICADNDSEYRGSFESYCKSNGIRLEKTIPKTSEGMGLLKG